MNEDNTSYDPADEDVEGHKRAPRVDGSGEDVEGHMRAPGGGRLDSDEDDVEGHLRAPGGGRIDGDDDEDVEGHVQPAPDDMRG